MPEKLWEEVQDLIQVGMGIPALFNDEVAVAAKRRLGVSWAKVIDLMLNSGVCPVTDEALFLQKPRDLARVGTFEELFDWYKKELCHFVDLGIRQLNISDRHFPRLSPSPFLSSTVEGCIEAGRDVTEGSTVYNFSSVNGCGMANAVNSLVAIKRLVSEERKMPLHELAKALRQGDDILLKRLERYPKFGNDGDEPDTMMKDLVEVFCREVDGHRNPRGGGGFRRGCTRCGGTSTWGGSRAISPTAAVGDCPSRAASLLPRAPICQDPPP